MSRVLHGLTKNILMGPPNGKRGSPAILLGYIVIILIDQKHKCEKGAKFGTNDA